MSIGQIATGTSQMDWVRGVFAFWVGLLAAAFTAFLAFAMTGAGHGWVESFPISMPLFLVYPVVLMRLVSRSGVSIRVDLALLVFALVADAHLISDTFGGKYDYFLCVLNVGVGFPYLWIAMWLLWQVFVGVTIMVRLKRRRALSHFAVVPLA